mgnify:FL=1
MRRLVGRKLPGTHAVRIMLGATLLAGVAAVVAARTPGDGAGDEGVAEAAGVPMGHAVTAANTAGSTASAQPYTTEEGAVPEPQPEQLPDTEQVSAAAKNRFSMPLRAWSKVTDRYGAKNRGAGLIHGGIDLALDGLSHSNVYAACTGTVSDASYSSACGNRVIVDCGGGWSAL